VKNQPFVVHLGISSNSSLSFEKLTVEPRLLYDCDNLKEVDFVKLKPLEYKNFPGETMEQLNVELKLKVLTSQLEDMLFRVKFTAFEVGSSVPLLLVVSEPIKVVSKPEQVKKVSKKQTTLTQPHPSTKKRDLNETLRDSLQRIEFSLDQYAMFMNRYNQLVDVNQVASSNIIQSLSQEVEKETVQEEFFLETVQTKEKPTQSPFQTALKSFLSSVDKVPQELRASKVRKASRSSPKDIEIFLQDIQDEMRLKPEPSKFFFDEKKSLKQEPSIPIVPVFPSFEITF